MENDNEMQENIEEIVRSFRAEKGLADDAYQIKIHDFGKKLLHTAQKIEELMGFEAADGAGKQGRKGKITVTKPKGQGKILVSYQIDLTSDPPTLDLAFTKNPLNFEPGVSQRVDLETHELSWGTRWYFVCQSCGRRCNVLYMAKGFHNFSCLKCQNLTYESCRLNRRTMKGISYYLVRYSQLADKREKIRPFYNGKRTKRFERFVGMYDRLEKMTQSEGFQNLLKLSSVH